MNYLEHFAPLPESPQTRYPPYATTISASAGTARRTKSIPDIALATLSEKVRIVGKGRAVPEPTTPKMDGLSNEATRPGAVRRSRATFVLDSPHDG